MSDFYIWLSEKGYTEEDIENLSSKELGELTRMYKEEEHDKK